MRISLSTEEIELLSLHGISFEELHEYCGDEAVDLLELVRDLEVAYSQGCQADKQYALFCNLADKIQSQIDSM